MMKIFIASLLFLGTVVSLTQAGIGCSPQKPCLNGGICLNKTCKCECAPSYYGAFCEYHSPCYRKCPNGTHCVRDGDKTSCVEMPCTNVADIGIVLDCSGSISRRQFRIMLRTVKTFINNLELGAKKMQVALFAFNDTISGRQIELNELNDNDAFLKELMKFGKEHTGGGTRTDRAIYHLMDMFNVTRGDRLDAPNIGILFTDGESTFHVKTKKAAEDLHADRPDINMFCVGIGSGIDVKELEMIASKKENVIITNFKKLPDIVEKLNNETCVKDPCSNNPCLNNGVCHVVIDTFVCLCPSPYNGARCEIKCDGVGDGYIILDESGSISPRNFYQMIDSLLFFIKGAAIDNGNVRIGLITYATDYFVNFNLNTFHDKIHMYFVVDLLRYNYRGGRTNTHKPLRYLIHEGFTPSRGDRKYAPNFVTIITDGKSTIPGLTRYYSNTLKKMKVTMYAVGVGRRVNKREIFDMASIPKRHHMIFSSFAAMKITMLKVRVQICKDIPHVIPVLRCRTHRDCPACMLCCKGSCQDRVTILMSPSYPTECIILECPTCNRKVQCATSKNCFWKLPICWRGCCQSLWCKHPWYYRNTYYRKRCQDKNSSTSKTFRTDVKKEHCKTCKHTCECRTGFKCCHGCCRKPIVVEAGCMESRICTQYVKYKRCGDGKICCKHCRR